MSMQEYLNRCDYYENTDRLETPVSVGDTVALMVANANGEHCMVVGDVLENNGGMFKIKFFGEGCTYPEFVERRGWEILKTSYQLSRHCERN